MVGGQRPVVAVVVRAAWTLIALAPAKGGPVTAMLTVEDAAAELGTPVRFVRRLIQERRIRFHKIGKYVRIARDDLEAFIAAGEVAPLRSSPVARRSAELSARQVTI